MELAATSKLSVMPLHTPSLSFIIFSSTKPKQLSFIIRPFCAIRTTSHNQRYGNDRRPPRPSSSNDSWIKKWPSSPKDQHKAVDVVMNSDTSTTRTRFIDKDPGQSAIQRIVLRLRNLGLGSDDDEEEDADGGLESVSVSRRGELSGEEKLGDLLKRDWIRPDALLLEEEDEEDGVLFPWDRSDGKVEEKVDESGKMKRKIVKAPTLAELTIGDEELRRLRRMGMTLRERISVAKAGVTQAIVEKMHDKWRNDELVRLKFHESLAHDMKTAHELVEKRSGGLIIWRAGSVMVVYRGSNYEGSAKSLSVNRQGDSLFIPDVSSADKSRLEEIEERSKPVLDNLDTLESMNKEEADYNRLLDGLCPRIVDWWSTGVLPVDADLISPSIPVIKHHLGFFLQA